MNAFRKATKEQSKLRMAIIAPAGAGKTFTALKIAGLIGKKVALIDTERGSASKYADLFDFDVLELQSFSPTTYTQAISEAEKAGYDVLVIDSLSHAWMGKDGALELVDKAAKRSQSNNSFAAWREVTPLHNALVDAMLGCNLHLIVTMRTKMDYVQELDEKTGRTVIRKVGLAPVQRDGLEYEFDVISDMTIDHDLIVSKTRCTALTDKVFNKPGQEVADILNNWLKSGAKPKAAPAPAPAPKAVEERNGKITAEQHKLLKELVKTYFGTTTESLLEYKDWMLQTYGTDAMADLSEGQATRAIDALKAKLEAA